MYTSNFDLIERSINQRLRSYFDLDPIPYEYLNFIVLIFCKILYLKSAVDIVKIYNIKCIRHIY